MFKKLVTVVLLYSCLSGCSNQSTPTVPVGKPKPTSTPVPTPIPTQNPKKSQKLVLVEWMKM